MIPDCPCSGIIYRALTFHPFNVEARVLYKSSVFGFKSTKGRKVFVQKCGFYDLLYKTFFRVSINTGFMGMLWSTVDSVRSASQRPASHFLYIMASDSQKCTKLLWNFVQTTEEIFNMYKDVKFWKMQGGSCTSPYAEMQSIFLRRKKGAKPCSFFIC